MEIEELEVNIDFETHFPGLISLICRYFTSYIPCFWKNTNFKIKTEAIIVPKISYWKIMCEFKNYETAFHSLQIIFLFLRDEEFKRLNKMNKNILLWAALLHDIEKRGQPIVFGKDLSHPFRSAWRALHIFSDLQIVKIDGDLLSEWDQIFSEAYVIDSNGKEVNNNKVLPFILAFLKKIFRMDCFPYNVLILILLHQTLPTIKKYNDLYLIPEDPEKIIKIFFDPEFFHLMKILMTHDSISHLLKKTWRRWEKASIKKEFDEIFVELRNKVGWGEYKEFKISQRKNF